MLGTIDGTLVEVINSGGACATGLEEGFREERTLNGLRDGYNDEGILEGPFVGSLDGDLEGNRVSDGFRDDGFDVTGEFDGILEDTVVGDIVVGTIDGTLVEGATGFVEGFREEITVDGRRDGNNDEGILEGPFVGSLEEVIIIGAIVGNVVGTRVLPNMRRDGEFDNGMDEGIFERPIVGNFEGERDDFATVELKVGYESFFRVRKERNTVVHRDITSNSK